METVNCCSYSMGTFNIETDSMLCSVRSNKTQPRGCSGTFAAFSKGFSRHLAARAALELTQSLEAHGKNHDFVNAEDACGLRGREPARNRTSRTGEEPAR